MISAQSQRERSGIRDITLPLALPQAITAEGRCGADRVALQSLSAAGLILRARAQREHLASSRRFAEAGPIRHQAAPLLEKIAATIGGLDLVFNRVRERHFDDLARIC